MKEQMMAQRTMLKDAIHHGHHLQAELDKYQEGWDHLNIKNN